MIEVEKKFILQNGNEARLIKGASFIKEISIHDVYHDTADYALTRKDWWLRNRNSAFELKISLSIDPAVRRLSDQYEEITSENEIARRLKLPQGKNLLAALEKSGYMPFCSIVTTRKKYEREGYKIDIDEMDFGYALAEIELMVASASEAPSAAEKILAFAARMGLSSDPIRGKVVEYLSRYCPGHFAALQKAGVIFAGGTNT